VENPLLAYLKASDPQIVLKDLLNGWQPSDSYLNTLEDIRTLYGFTDEVLNVLINYVILTRKCFRNEDAHAMAKFISRGNTSSAEQAMSAIREAIAKKKDAN